MQVKFSSPYSHYVNLCNRWTLYVTEGYFSITLSQFFTHTHSQQAPVQLHLSWKFSAANILLHDKAMWESFSAKIFLCSTLELEKCLHSFKDNRKGETQIKIITVRSGLSFNAKQKELQATIDFMLWTAWVAFHTTAALHLAVHCVCYFLLHYSLQKCKMIRSQKWPCLVLKMRFW